MGTEILSADKIKAEALRLGFSACGVARAEAVDEKTSEAFRRWCAQGMQAGMNYMGNHTDKRLDPRLLMEGTRTIVSVALNYYPARQLGKDQYQFAWYAYGKDYHDIMKMKLQALQTFICREYPPSTAHSPLSEEHAPFPLQSRIFCDTAPVLERYWAYRAGLGWIGKNTQLIIPHAGSCFFLGEIFLNVEVDKYDTPQEDRCGNCRRCMNACPTKALERPYLLNSRRCLSYLTIENREKIPPAEGKKMGNKIYGCDDCQKACPWNRFAAPCRTPELQPSDRFMQMEIEDWQVLTEDQYRTLFKGSAVKRAKYAGLMRNISSHDSRGEEMKSENPID